MLRTPRLAIFAATLSTLSPLLIQTALGGSFSYQGQLRQDARPVTDLVDLTFTLFDSQTDGLIVGSPIMVSGVDVVHGLFQVQLDFGDGAFDGSARWLDIQVKLSADARFATLEPRQEITPSPMALYALESPDSQPVSGTLDDAYDSGGAGVGAAIQADAGPVHISGADGLVVDGGLTSGPVRMNHDDADMDIQVRRTYFPTLGGNPPVVSIGGTVQPVGPLGANASWAMLRTTSAHHAVRRDTGSSLTFDVEGSINSAAPVTQMTLTDDGNLGIGILNPDTRLQVFAPNGDAEPGSGGIMTVGRTIARNIVMDDNEIMARDNGVTSPLYLNNDGGDVLVSAGGLGDLGVGTSNPKGKIHVDGDYYGLGHVWLHAYEGDGSSGTAYVQARDTSSTSSIDLQFRTKSGPNFRDVMKLKSNGDVLVQGSIDIGYQVVSSSGNDVFSRTVSCPSGKQVLSGGCAVGLNNILITSAPAGTTGWHCAVDDNSGPVTAYAICARVK